EVPRDVEHHLRLDLPALPPWPMLGCVEPGVISNALVLDLFDGVPAPQVRGLLLRTGEVPLIGEQLVRDDRRKMLERHGRSDIDDRRPFARDRKALLDLRFELREVIARLRRSAVERGMLAAVDRLLGRKSLDLVRK